MIFAISMKMANPIMHFYTKFLKNICVFPSKMTFQTWKRKLRNFSEFSLEITSS